MNAGAKAAVDHAIETIRYEIGRCFENERMDAGMRGLPDPFPMEKQARLAEWLWCAGYRHLTKDERKLRADNRMKKVRK